MCVQPLVLVGSASNFLFYSYCRCMSMLLCVNAGHSAHADVRGQLFKQLVSVSFHRGNRESNSGQQACSAATFTHGAILPAY